MSLQLLPTILELLNGSTSDQMSSKLDLNSTQVTTAATIAIPLIIQAMSKNSQEEKGAESLAKALAKDHDGSILENVAGYIEKSDLKEGQGILKHLIGSNSSGIAETIGTMAGIDKDKSTQILSMLAPIVLGLLGKYMTQKNLSPTELAANLAEEENEVGSAVPGAVSMFKSLLDSNGDGQIGDDALKIGGQLLGAFLKNR
ncbi:DUF937 domain-containing protein [Leptospira sp. GIMC2001]|uniref:DUF937 domain-containing protein n=1 Tax=Leptospira sp. GIMC2001 TaxID=1513297 RepID=UPI00234A5831|nr:DUF937 domain-containing protein [Leptospira sp. GIMC2001]WCL50446.1 DUF937 domain-containing protein [Leptospira sp. GIMC2001]